MESYTPEDQADRIDTQIDFVARVLVALIGGLSLILPLIMMTFLTSVAARLAIVCCSVLGFSITVGFATKATN